MTANAEQAELWNGDSGETWVKQQQRLDNQLEPLGRAVIAALAPVAGERVLDIGCGAGQTTQQLVEAGAAAVGCDISKPLLEMARGRFAALEFVEGDAQTHAFAPASFDAVFSRFGVMFFADPKAAFANLRAALKPGGRIAFVCWRALAENPFMTVPLEAAVGTGRIPMPDAPVANAPGPFAFADKDYLAGVLGEAGFADISIVPHDEKIGGNALGNAVQLAVDVGPLGHQIREYNEFRTGAISAVWDVLEKNLVGGKVMLASATWIVTAKRPLTDSGLQASGIGSDPEPAAPAEAPKAEVPAEAPKAEVPAEAPKAEVPVETPPKAEVPVAEEPPPGTEAPSDPKPEA